MLLQYPPEEDVDPAIPRLWLRPSQIKIQYENPTRSQQVLEVVAPTQLATPHRISSQIIANLNYNGVPTKVLGNVAHEAMEEIYSSFTNWDGEYAFVKLYKLIADTGGVLNMRLERVNNQATRARGYLVPDIKEIEDYGDDESTLQSSTFHTEPYSGTFLSR